MTYMTTYARETLKLSSQVSLAAPIINGSAGVLFGPHRRSAVGPPGSPGDDDLAAGLLHPGPVAGLLPDGSTTATRRPCSRGIFVLAGASALTTASVFVAIAESLRKEVRGLALGGVYAIAVAVFGGGTQPAITWLIHETGDPLSPAWCSIAFAVAGLAASLMIRETAAGAHART